MSTALVRVSASSGPYSPCVCVCTGAASCRSLCVGRSRAYSVELHDRSTVRSLHVRTHLSCRSLATSCTLTLARSRCIGPSAAPRREAFGGTIRSSMTNTATATAYYRRHLPPSALPWRRCSSTVLFVCSRRRMPPRHRPPPPDLSIITCHLSLSLSTSVYQLTTYLLYPPHLLLAELYTMTNTDDHHYHYHYNYEIRLLYRIWFPHRSAANRIESRVFCFCCLFTFTINQCIQMTFLHEYQATAAATANTNTSWYKVHTHTQRHHSLDLRSESQLSHTVKGRRSENMRERWVLGDVYLGQLVELDAANEPCLAVVEAPLKCTHASCRWSG